mmetsp:Transcript_12483/g.17129  ORF Transcript_12483/g.17129 Transcript_12483/m.17129 type:complete len:270 (-) Transcript_12483:85-894(-)
MQLLILLFVLQTVSFISVLAGGGIPVIASVRGKKYDITAETVEEFTNLVESVVPGLEAGQQSVLFRGKVLSPQDRLEDIGVGQGDVLNVLKGRKPNVRSPSAVESSISESVSGFVPPSADSKANAFGFTPGMSQEEYQEALKNANPEDVKNAMNAMDNMLDSNVFEEYLSDDDKLEKARQQMLANMDHYATMMPGFKEQVEDIASDPEKWKQAMYNAKEQISKLRQQRDAIRAKSGVVPPSPSGDASSSSSSSSVDDVVDEEDSSAAEE